MSKPQCSMNGCNRPSYADGFCEEHAHALGIHNIAGFREPAHRIVSDRGMKVKRKHQVPPGNCTKCRVRVAGYCCDAPGCGAALCGRCVVEVAGSEYCPAHDPSGEPRKTRKKRTIEEEEE